MDAPTRQPQTRELRAEARWAVTEAIIAFRGALRNAAFYELGHPTVQQWLAQTRSAIGEMLGEESSLTWNLVEGEIVAGRTRVSDGTGNMADFIEICRARRVETITWEMEVEVADVQALVTTLLLDPREVEARGGAAAALVAAGATRVTVGQLAREAEQERRTDARQVYHRALNLVENLMTSVRAGEHIDLIVVSAVANELVEMVLTDRAALLAMTTLHSYDAYTFAHSVNVSILTLTLASKIAFSRPHLAVFGEAGLLHDIGKVKVPLEILRNPGKLTPEELAEMRVHPVAGAALLVEDERIPHLAPVVAFEHHLGPDATGYPRLHKARKPHLCSLMTAIADCFEALTSYRPYREPVTQAAALSMMERMGPGAFDTRLLCRFGQMLGVCTRGSVAELTTGEIGVVFQANPDDGMLPPIILVRDANGREIVEKRRVDLAAEGEERRVARLYYPSEVGVKVAEVLEEFPVERVESYSAAAAPPVR